ncbi:hypothetical protein AAFM71_11385 [Chromobacterium violaceum]|uniref:hypothetical protein n=1 Tax=Chromobacterium violaceum TaxID=536 RepID=UPI003858392E
MKIQSESTKAEVKALIEYMREKEEVMIVELLNIFSQESIDIAEYKYELNTHWKTNQNTGETLEWMSYRNSCEE